MDETRAVGVRQRDTKTPLTIGFTLIELLTVIGIVATLIAILLPVFSHARERGMRTTCQSHQRQMAAAMGQYVHDYDGVYPEGMFPYKKDGVTTIVLWHEVLFPYTKSRAIIRCPSQGRAVTELENHGDGYNFNNQRLNTFKWLAGTPGEGKLMVEGKHESHFPNSSAIWLTSDRVAVENGQCVDCTVSAASCGRAFYGSTVHGGGGNYSFLDGHVKWYTPDAMAEVDCQNDPLPLH